VNYRVTPTLDQSSKDPSSWYAGINTAVVSVA